MDNYIRNQFQKPVLNGGRDALKITQRVQTLNLTTYYPLQVLPSLAQQELSHPDCTEKAILKSCFLTAIREQNLTRRAHRCQHKSRGLTYNFINWKI